MEMQVHQFTWDGIDIEVLYFPKKFGAISHVKVRSLNPARQALPITETGYRSHFVPIGTVEQNGGDVVTLVRDWLDAEVRKPAWIEHRERSRQGVLAL